MRNDGRSRMSGVLLEVLCWVLVSLALAGGPVTDVVEAQAVGPRRQVTWETLPDLPVGVLASAASLIDHDDGAAVVTGGILQSGSAGRVVQVLDLRTLRWATPVMLTQGRCRHAQVTLADGRVLVVGGESGRVTQGLKPTATCELVDLGANRSDAAPPLPAPVGQPTAHRLGDGRVVVIGGRRASVFDPTRRQWVQHVQLRAPRAAHVSLLMADGKLLVIGGEGQASIEQVDLSLGRSLMLAAKLPMPLDDTHAAILPDGRVWILGGQDSRGGRTTDATWLLDLSNPRRAALTPGPSLQIPGGVADAQVGVISASGGAATGPVAILTGGESDQNDGDRELAVTRLLDLRSLTVWSLPDTAAPHDDAASFVVGRSMIVFGGYEMRRSLLGLSGLNAPVAIRRVERITLPPGKTP